MARSDDDAVWADAETGNMFYDHHWDVMVPELDYVLDGSISLTYWEAMAYSIQGIQAQRDPARYQDGL